MRWSWRKVVAGVAGAFVAVCAWLVLQWYPIGASGRPVIVTVQAGEGLGAITNSLHRSGVLATPIAFRLDLAVEGSILVQPGDYQIAQGSSFATVRSILSNPPNVVRLAVRPGLTISEVVARMSAARGVEFGRRLQQALTPARTPSTFGGNSLEGLVGAGVYVVTPDMGPEALAREMVTRFERQARSVGLSPSSTHHNLSAYQTVIAASIVEKEGYFPVNMPRVARTILNRLARGGGLQMDSTVLYALGRDGGTVTPADLRTRTPYNTYLHAGLTPTPICVVSMTALRAMLNPPPGPWLYFVVIDRAGHEAFAATFAEQLRNEQRARAAGL